jgi:AcrR family transcriptional regulator
MNSQPDVKRSYDSPLRKAQAAATRRAIIDAAATSFIERGYVATSIETIAEAAGVSRATVFTSVGGKKELLKKAYDVALVGDDEPVPFPLRPASLAVRAEPDPARFLVG